jgi:hypothetical protein
MELLVTACRIHNGGMPQSEPTLAVCLDADRLDLGRVGITPDPLRLSTSTAKAIASGLHPANSSAPGCSVPTIHTSSQNEIVAIELSK